MSEDGIMPDPDKVSGVHKLPVPRNVADIHSQFPRSHWVLSRAYSGVCREDSGVCLEVSAVTCVAEEERPVSLD